MKEKKIKKYVVIATLVAVLIVALIVLALWVDTPTWAVATAFVAFLGAVLGFSGQLCDLYKKINSFDSSVGSNPAETNNNNGLGIQNNNTTVRGNQFNYTGDGNPSIHMGDTVHGDKVAGGKTVNQFGVALIFEQWKKGVEARRFELEELLSNPNGDPSKQQQRTQELQKWTKELDAVAALLANPRESYKVRIKELEEQVQRLQALKGVFPKETLEQALTALRSGDSKQADELFAEVEAQAEPSIEATAEACYQRGLIAGAEIRYGEALAHFERAHQLAPHNMDCHLAYVDMLYELADYGEALRQYQKLLSMQEQALGAEHEDVVATLNNMGRVYQAQGDYAKALEYYERVLSIQKKALGGDHPSYATTLNNMGEMYRTQGDYAKALEDYERALSIREKALGEDHPNVAATLNNMGFVYQAQGDDAKALDFYERALAIFEKVFEPDHPHIQGVKGNIEALRKNALRLH